MIKLFTNEIFEKFFENHLISLPKKIDILEPLNILQISLVFYDEVVNIWQVHKIIKYDFPSDSKREKYLNQFLYDYSQDPGSFIKNDWNISNPNLVAVIVSYLSWMNIVNGNNYIQQTAAMRKRKNMYKTIIYTEGYTFDNLAMVNQIRLKNGERKQSFYISPKKFKNLAYFANTAEQLLSYLREFEETGGELDFLNRK